MAGISSSRVHLGGHRDGNRYSRIDAHQRRRVFPVPARITVPLAKTVVVGFIPEILLGVCLEQTE